MKTTNLFNVSLMFLSAILLTGCGGSSKNSEPTEGEEARITVDGTDLIIKHNELVTEDGSKGFKGDLENTNLQTVYEGLTFDKVYLIDGDDKKIDGEQVPLNSKFSIVIEGIKNYTVKDGKAFPKLTLMLTGETGLVVAEEDALASYTEGVSLEDASVLRGTFTVAAPMAVGKMYSCIVSVTDKNNTNATIQSSWLFTVK